ncbi:MAG: toxin-antitoxin system YwqK family antitoxin [Bacteroidales bacterium]
MQYRDGKLNGKCEWYFESGKISQSVTYRDNQLEGEMIQYHENGTVSMIGYYRNNLKDSLFTYFNPSGKIVTFENYQKDSLHGPFKRFYESGPLMLEGTYNSQQMDGVWLFYKVSGEITGKGEFVNGNGIQKSWFPNGKIQRIIHYKNSLKEGRDEYYTDDGKLASVRIFEKGIQISEQIPD